VSLLDWAFCTYWDKNGECNQERIGYGRHCADHKTEEEKEQDRKDGFHKSQHQTLKQILDGVRK